MNGMMSGVKRAAMHVAPTLLLLASGSLVLPAQEAKLRVKAENTLKIARTDETISIPWANVMRDLPAASPQKVRVRDESTGQEVVSQVVDENGDGTMDDLIFQASFWPKSTRTFSIEAVAAKTAAPRTYATHIEERDDVAWENDRIAFRIYGEGLSKVEDLVTSGIDVWPKSVRDLIIDKWYAKGHDDYHVDTGEGADFFEVGKTLGAGGTGLWVKDTLVRAANFKSYRIIAKGPIRAIFELQYAPVDVPGRKVAETKRFAIDAGQNLYRQESVFRVVSATGAAATARIPYAIGVVKKDGLIGSTSRANKWAWVTGWAPVHKKHGGHGYLGTAVMLDGARLTDFKETAEHYIAITDAAPGETVVHYIGAGWTDSGDFHDVMDWWGYLDTFAQRLATPVTVTVTK